MSGDSKLPISIDIGAKAEAKFDIRAEIPASASGRFLNAVVDAFSPFTERRGLAGDQIRLQREDVLLKIAEKARARIDAENSAKTPIPAKIFVPLLEKASLESLDSELLDWWAGLVANGSTDKELQHPIFADFLAKMTSSEAKLLDKLASWKSHPEPAFQFDIEGQFNKRVNEQLKDFLDENRKNVSLSDRGDRSEEYYSFAKNKLAEFFNQLSEFGIIGIEISFPISTYKRILDEEAPYGGEYPIHRAIDNCVSMGVLVRERFVLSIFSPFIGEYSVNLHVARFTATGEMFLKACRNNSEADR